MIKEKYDIKLLISTILLAIISVFSFTTEVLASSLYGDFYYTLNSDFEVRITGVRSGATDVKIPTKINGYPVKYIVDNAFEGSDITSVVVPSTIEEVGEYAFKNCKKLKTVTLKNDYISEGMFYGASSLTKVNFLGNITSITEYAFANCTSLKSLIIPNTVTSLDRSIFDGASSLAKVVVPSSVTNFYYKWWNDEYPFYNTPSSLTLYVEKGSEAERHAVNYGIKYVIVKDISSAKVASIANQTYTGKAITPKVVVKDGNKTLVNGTDYTVSYKNNVKVGTATVTITGKYAYYGTITKTFKIVSSSNGLKYNTKNKRWEYYRNGKPDYTYTGFASNKNGTFYVQKGIITYKYNKLVKYKGKWTAVVNSRVTPKYTGISTNSNGSYYLKNGVLSYKYNGTYKDSKGNIYVLKNSKVDTSVNGLKKVSGTWYYFKKGKTDLTYTGFASNKNGTYYVQKGKITYKYNKLVKYKGKWTAVVNSKVQPKYTGLSKNNNGTFLLINGTLNYSYNGYIIENGNVYILKNSKVNTGFTGLKKVGGVWLYFKKGVTNYKYTGLAKNSNGTYYVQKGVVTFKYNGKITYKGKVYTVKNSKVIM